MRSAVICTKYDNHLIFNELHDTVLTLKAFARFLLLILTIILPFWSILFQTAFNPEDTMKTIDSRKRRTIQLASGAVEIHGTCDADVFLSRLKLLIIMAKACLCKCPIGDFRKQAVAENSNHVFYGSLMLLDTPTNSKHHTPAESSDSPGKKTALPVGEFRQRVQGLAFTIRSIAQDRSLLPSETAALRENLNAITRVLSFDFEIDTESFLRAA